MKIQKDTLSSLFIKRCERNNPCSEAIVWMKDKSKDNLTMDTLLKKFIKDDNASSGWSSWCLRTLGDDLSSEVRDGFIQKIKDPMQAFKLYTKYSGLTNDEIVIIKQKFKDKLPKAEKELKDGLIFSIRSIDG